MMKSERIKPVKKTIRRLNLEINEIKKEIYQTITLPRNQSELLFVVGCQRSGTTLLQKVFRRDWTVKTYKETDVLSNQDRENGIRLNPLAFVEDTFSKSHAKLIVAKPLVESQRTVEILDFFSSAKAIWQFRYYQDVAASNLKRFGLRNGINNLRPIVSNDPDNWRSEGLGQELRELVLEYFSEDMKPHDAAALFWLIRNSWFFTLNLGQHKRVSMSKYEDFVEHPYESTCRMYSLLGLKQPDVALVKEVHARSVKKGKDIDLTSEIAKQCEDMWEQLCAEYTSQLN